MSRTSYLDVVILPPPKVMRAAINASRLLAQRFGSTLVLDLGRTLPHISLYHLAVVDTAPFGNRLAEIAGSTEPGEIEITGIHLYREFGSLAIELSKPEWLRRFYLRLLHGLNPLRDPQFDNDRAWESEKLSKEQRKYIARYGTPLVGRSFIPHITLGVIADRARLDEAASAIKRPQGRFRVTEIAVCEQGPHHSCRAPLFTQPLK
jgi:2'-5' RNA ligase